MINRVIFVQHTDAPALADALQRASVDAEVIRARMDDLVEDWGDRGDEDDTDVAPYRRIADGEL